MSALSPIPFDCVTQGNITPAMRQWMMNALVDAIGFDNAIIALQAARAPRNLLLNGDFAIWQRGTSFFATVAGANRSADRWDYSRFSTTGCTATRQTTTPPAGFTQYLRLQRTAANASTATMALCQSLESVDSAFLAGQTVTLSAYVRAGANLSSAGLLARLVLQSGTGTDQNGCVAYTGSASTENDPAVSTSWARYSVTYAVPASATELCLFIAWNPTGTAGAADYIDIAGVQLEIGSAPTAFDYRTFGEQLMRCKRYYHKSFPYATPPATGATGVGATLAQTFRAGANAIVVSENFPVQMRVVPTVSYFNPVTFTTSWRNTTLGADSAVGVSGALDARHVVIQNNQIATDAVGNIFTIHWSADAEL